MLIDYVDHRDHCGHPEIDDQALQDSGLGC
jgi:hypothetical protein